MNPDVPLTPEEFLKQVQEIQAELAKARAKAWLKAKDAINQYLDNSGLPENDARTSLFSMLQAAWVNGYNTGAQDLSKYMMREMGLGHIVDFNDSLTALQQQITKTKPENN